MPGKLVLGRIRSCFGSVPLRVTDNVLFHLCPNSTDPEPRQLELEYALAVAGKDFAGNHIVPLHQQLKVSVQAMAIQLSQLGVLLYPVTSARTDL